MSEAKLETRDNYPLAELRLKSTQSAALSHNPTIAACRHFCHPSKKRQLNICSQSLEEPFSIACMTRFGESQLNKLPVDLRSCRKPAGKEGFRHLKEKTCFFDEFFAGNSTNGSFFACVYSTWPSVCFHICRGRSHSAAWIRETHSFLSLAALKIKFNIGGGHWRMGEAGTCLVTVCRQLFCLLMVFGICARATCMRCDERPSPLVPPSVSHTSNVE